MLISFLRTVILYSLLIVSIRMMGKRQIGELGPAEFVVTMLLANIAAIPMQDTEIPLLSGIVPIMTILGMELILSVMTMLSVRWRRILCGKPVILIADGKIQQKNLRSTRVSLDELTEHLRGKDIFDLSTVKYAILETGGELSVIPYAKYMPAPAKATLTKVPDQELPYTVISDGKILKTNLELLGKTETWLHRYLAGRNRRAEDVFLMTVDSKGGIFLSEKEQTA
ncbi:MAG: DUF421 domain-containing protein [Clostridia bacterium]|nr:DUF421 domain-containing protein [Clostridia bacterium]